MRTLDAVLMVFIVSIAMIAAFYSGSRLTTGTGPQSIISAPTTGTTAEGACAYAPTLAVQVRDKATPSTAVTATSVYRMNGVYYATAPTVNKGDKVTVLSNASNYVNALSSEQVMGCGANTITQDTYAYSAPTIKIKEDATTLTDNAAGGANNASAIATGGSATYKVSITGVDKKTSGDLIFAVELGANANVSAITMYNEATGANLETIATPTFYTNTLTSPKVAFFKVPQVVGAKEMVYKVSIAANSGKAVNGAVYTSFYVAQPFVQTDGTFVTEGIENIDGTTKYLATFDYDFYITP